MAVRVWQRRFSLVSFTAEDQLVHISLRGSCVSSPKFSWRQCEFGRGGFLRSHLQQRISRFTSAKAGLQLAAVSSVGGSASSAEEVFFGLICCRGSAKFTSTKAGLQLKVVSSVGGGASSAKEVFFGLNCSRGSAGSHEPSGSSVSMP